MSLHDEYGNLFSNWSFNNDSYAKISLHTLIGQLIKYQTIPKSGVILDSRINAAILQDSGSGKSTPFDLISRLAAQVGLSVRTLDEFSDASLIGTVEKQAAIFDEDGDEEWTVTDGILKQADIIHWDEGSVLLNPKHYQTSSMNYFQKALNPIGSESNRIFKELAHGPAIEIQPECSFLLTTFYPENIVQKVATTGFFQRLLVMPRRLTTHDRTINALHDIDVLGTSIDAETGVGEIADKLMEIKDFSTGEQIKFTEGVKPVLKNKVISFLKLVQTPNERISRLLYTFIPRYQDHMYRLAMHSAAMRLDNRVRPMDIRYANTIIEPLFSNIISWLESDADLAQIPKREQDYLVKMHRIYQKMDKDDDQYVGSGSFVNELIGTLALTKPTVYSYIKIFEERGFIEKKKEGRKVSYRLPKAIQKVSAKPSLKTRN